MAIRLRGRRAYTDRVQGLWGDSVDDAFPRTWMPPAHTAARTLGTLRLPGTAKLRAGAMKFADVVLYSSLAPHAQGSAAGLHQDRNGEGTGQTARLAAWEDEGGATARLK